jgi:single-strand DNA-binding protein
MQALNRVMLIGNLGKDPKVAALNNGSKVASFSIATSESWKDKASGDRRERTEWHNVVVYNEGLIGVAEKYLKKGARVYVEGELRTRKYQDQAGADRYTTEIVLSAYKGAILMLDKSERAPPAEDDYGTPRTRPATAAGGGGGAPAAHELDDDIPF